MCCTIIAHFPVKSGICGDNNLLAKKQIFQKMLKLILDKQTFTSSDARFCHGTCNDGSYMQNFVPDMHNFSLEMVLSL